MTEQYETIYNIDDHRKGEPLKYLNLSVADYTFNVTQFTRFEFLVFCDFELIDKNNLTLKIIKFERKLVTRDAHINQKDEEFFTRIAQARNSIPPLIPHLSRDRYTHIQFMM